MSYIGKPITTLNFPVDYFSGDGSTTQFNLQIAPASTSSILVALDGVEQSPVAYTLNGTQITFTEAPPTTVSNNIVVRHLGTPVGIGAPADGTVSSVKLASGILAQGQCRLSRITDILLRLDPHNGNGLTINGVIYTIPSAGVSLANTGLTAATLYYIYAYMNASVMTLEASATGYATSSTTGMKIKTGDDSRTLVGMVYMGAGTPGIFVNTATERYTRSWFNDPGFNGLNTFTADRSTASGSFVELNSEIRCQFISWSNEILAFTVNGSVALPGGVSVTHSAVTSIGIDSATEIVGFASGINDSRASAGDAGAGAISVNGSYLSTVEGYHYVTVIARTSGHTCTWYAATSASVARTSLHVSTPGLR